MYNTSNSIMPLFVHSSCQWSTTTQQVVHILRCHTTDSTIHRHWHSINTTLNCSYWQCLILCCYKLSFCWHLKTTFHHPSETKTKFSTIINLLQKFTMQSFVSPIVKSPLMSISNKFIYCAHGCNS